MESFEQRLDRVPTEWNPLSNRRAGSGIAPALDKLGQGSPPPGMGNPQLKNRHAAPAASLEKFSKAPFHIHPEDIQAMLADPSDGDVFDRVAARHGKPVAAMLRQAAMGQPNPAPSPHHIR